MTGGKRRKIREILEKDLNMRFSIILYGEKNEEFRKEKGNKTIKTPSSGYFVQKRIPRVV